MKDIRKRLEGELNQTVARLRRMGSTVVLEELAGTPGDNSPFADEVDTLQLSEDREMSFATRSILVDRANKLAEALKRFDDGEYATSVSSSMTPTPSSSGTRATTITAGRSRSRRPARVPSSSWADGRTARRWGS